MALVAIQPFTFNGFLAQLGEYVPDICDSLLQHEEGGWIELLQRYQFNDMEYAEGEQIRQQYHAAIRDAATDKERGDVANQILQWGNMPHLDERILRQVNASLGAPDDPPNSDLNAIYASRIASVSKIYEMWEPSSWAIFDSYSVYGGSLFNINRWKNIQKIDVVNESNEMEPTEVIGVFATVVALIVTSYLVGVDANAADGASVGDSSFSFHAL